MLELRVPHGPSLQLAHVVLDLNGTLATDGRLDPLVVDALRSLGEVLSAHVVTADTHGTARDLARSLPATVEVLPGDAPGGPAKRAVLARLGADRCVMVGNGRNDVEAMRSAALAIAVLGGEGAAADCLAAAHVVCRSGVDALRLLASPERLVATLRG